MGSSDCLGRFLVYADARRCNVNIFLLSLSRPNWNVVSFQIVLLSPCGGVTLVCRSHKNEEGGIPLFLVGLASFLRDAFHHSYISTYAIAFSESFFAAPTPKVQLCMRRKRKRLRLFSAISGDKNKRKVSWKRLSSYLKSYILRLTVVFLFISGAISCLPSCTRTCWYLSKSLIHNGTFLSPDPFRIKTTWVLVFLLVGYAVSDAENI